MEKFGKVMNSHELVLSLEKILISSNVLIRSIENCDKELKNFYLLKSVHNNKDISIYINVRNIGSAYLPNKPYIFRRQVGKLSFDDLPLNSENCISILAGITLFKGKLILVCWNPFYFVGHSTNRSCYVLEKSIERAMNFGLYVGEDCKTPVFICDENHFIEMIDIYMERNMVD